MRHQDLQLLPPEVEGPWPLLQITPADRLPALRESKNTREPHLRPLAQETFLRDTKNAALKGFLLGILCFSLFFGVPSTFHFWAISWHWLWLLVGLLLLLLLIGKRYTLLIIGGVVLILGLIALITHWLSFLLFLAIGTCVRMAYELLPIR